MYPWVQLGHLAYWSQAKCSAEFPRETPVRGLTTDSRAVREGEVFLALKGPSFDGHEYAAKAVEQGAVGVISERPLEGVGAPLMQVESTLEALCKIAENHRERFEGPVIAITGSAGKSSTKEMLGVLLDDKSLIAPASFNNLIGVSKTLLMLEASTERIVLEMGMNAEGEIAELCKRFRPNIGAITNIGDAHLGKVGGPEAVYRAKKELFDFLGTHGGESLGVALNQDDERVMRAYEESFHQFPRRVTYTCVPKPRRHTDVIVEKAEVDPKTGYLAVVVNVRGDRVEASLPLFGKHHAQNLAAAVALGWLADTPVQQMAARMQHIHPGHHRGELIAFGEDSTLIDECFNSNPTALRSSLNTLSEMESDRRRIVVLGAMAELGDFTDECHSQFGDWLADTTKFQTAPVSWVFVGPEMEKAWNAFSAKAQGAEGRVVPDAEAAAECVKDSLRPGDIVYLKGSRRVGLEKVRDFLIPSS